MTLALLNEQLSSTISSVLLGDVGGHQQGSKVNQGGPKGFEFVDWTNAEMFAKDVSSNFVCFSVLLHLAGDLKSNILNEEIFKISFSFSVFGNTVATA